MKYIFLTLAFIGFSAHADTKLVIDKQVFSIRPAPEEQPSCSDGPGGPEYAAAIMLMNTAQGLGERLGNPVAGIEGVFQFIRRYPSRFKSPNCAGPLRDECEKKCNAVKGFEPRRCEIECNQYETWNN